MDRSLSSTVAIEATVKVGGTTIELNGKADPAGKKLEVTGKHPSRSRPGSSAAPRTSRPTRSGSKPWMRVDLKKLKPTSSLRQSFDVEAQTGIIGGITTAEQVGEAPLPSGPPDLAKAAEAAGDNVAMRDGLESGAKLAKDPGAIPFEATVDAEGRLTTLSYTIATKELGDMVTDITLSGFGEPVKVTKPPTKQTEEAPKEMYKFL